MELTNKTIQPKPAKPTLLEHGVLVLTAIIALALDQITKRIIEANIPVGGVVAPIEAIGRYFSLTNTQNTGAAFSLFQNGRLFFIAVAIVVSCLILYYAPRLSAGEWLSRLALGLQLAGALGNLIDRLRQGYVTDFLHLQIPQISFDWPVSNFADMSIVAGVIILIIASLRHEETAAKQEEQEGHPVTE